MFRQQRKRSTPIALILPPHLVIIYQFSLLIAQTLRSNTWPGVDPDRRLTWIAYGGDGPDLAKTRDEPIKRFFQEGSR